MQRFRSAIPLIAVLIILLMLPYAAVCQDDASDDLDDSLDGASDAGYGETSGIGGRVYQWHNDEKVYLPNMTISVERKSFEGRSTLSDENGSYELSLPSGYFILRIRDLNGDILYRDEFFLNSSEFIRLDYGLDPENIRQSRISGTVENIYSLTPVDDAEIVLIRKGTDQEYTTHTDEDGYFEIMVPAGSYEFMIIAEDEEIYNESFSITFKEEKDMDLDPVQLPSRQFTLDNFLGFLKLNWLNLIFIVLILAVGVFALAALSRFFDGLSRAIADKPRKYMDSSIVHFIKRVFRWNVYILMVILCAYLLAHMLHIETTIWVPIQRSINSIYLIIILVILLRVILMIWKQFVQYMRGDREGVQPKRFLSPRLVTIIEILGKYFVVFLFVMIILIIALAALGMRDLITGAISNFFVGNAGELIFIVTLFLIAYILVRFMSTFFQDMKYKTTRFRPEMIEMAEKGVKFFVYAIIGMIVMFTILSAAGLGDVGQTLILVFSMIIGLVVSMAATGSIGNLLSGMVIMSFKPFEEGDWVIVADKYTGQVMETNMMFTKMRDLENEIIEVPNNLVLSTGVINWTSAAKSGHFAVDVQATIGYDVPAAQTIRLMNESVKGIPGVLDNPEPHVVMDDFLDHTISYKLRAYINDPSIRFRVKTDIMIRMQKHFADEGVEILSPAYHMVRSEKIPTASQVKRKVTNLQRQIDKAVESGMSTPTEDEAKRLHVDVKKPKESPVAVNEDSIAFSSESGF